MANGDPVPDPETLVRRFDPDDDDHWSAPDDGGVARLRSLALMFDPAESGHGRDVSVYQDSKLTPPLSRADVLDVGNEDWDVAVATVAEVRSTKRATVPDQPNPFSVVEDAFPELPQNTRPRDVAHALITDELSRKAGSRWESELAHTFRVESLWDQGFYA